MNNKKNLLKIIAMKNSYQKQFLLFLLFLPLVGFGQQQAMFTQYMFNTPAINPAYAASFTVPTVTFLAREQWVGFEGAPSTQTFSIHTPFRPEKIGIGISAINDKIGPIKESAVFFDFAYQIKVSQNANLSFGAKGGFSMFRASFSEMNTVQQNDIAFQQDINGRFLPNFGFGCYYYTKKFYIGASVPKLLQNEISINNDIYTGSANKEERHYFLVGGYLFDINQNVKFKPSFQTKFVNGSPIGIDLTANFLLKEKFWVAPNLRVGESVGIILQGIFGNMKVGYAYDFPFNEIGEYTTGSHEILLSFDLIFNDLRVKSPRYF